MSAHVAALFEGRRVVPMDDRAVRRLDIDPLVDDDFHLALYALYELHYGGFADVDAGLEWNIDVLGFRGVLERWFEEAVRADVGPVATPVPASSAGAAIRDLMGSEDGPSLSGFMAEQGSLEQFRELAVHRSPYQLKEADPHTFAIPRLRGRAKAAMVTIQADEYGGGNEVASHAYLFATTMRELGLDDREGAYLDVIPGVTLATVNLVSLFALHRRLRGAIVGHLALFEMASVVPMGRYASAVRRLGVGDNAATFYDVHVEADAVHEVIAEHRLAAAFAESEPDLASDVVFGAAALMKVERRFAEHVLDSWDAGRSSLRKPVEARAVA